MAEETDGIEEAVEEQLRVAIAAAGQIGETIAEVLEKATRRAQTASEQGARELTFRIEVERRAARTEIANVDQAGWWDQSTPEQIGRTYQVTRAWRRDDPEAARIETWMRNELHTRYGIDVDATGAAPEDVQQLVRKEAARAERDRMNADAERSHAASEEAEAFRLLTVSDQERDRAAAIREIAEYEPHPHEHDRAAAEAEQRERTATTAREDARDQYDSALRRTTAANELERQGVDPELAQKRMRADISQGRPATEATKSTNQAISLRAARSHGVEVQRTGLDR